MGIIALVVSFGTRRQWLNAIGEVLTQFNYMPAFGVATAWRSHADSSRKQLERIVGKSS